MFIPETKFIKTAEVLGRGTAAAMRNTSAVQTPILLAFSKVLLSEYIFDVGEWSHNVSVYLLLKKKSKLKTLERQTITCCRCSFATPSSYTSVVAKKQKKKKKKDYAARFPTFPCKVLFCMK